MGWVFQFHLLLAEAFGKYRNEAGSGVANLLSTGRVAADKPGGIERFQQHAIKDVLSAGFMMNMRNIDWYLVQSPGANVEGDPQTFPGPEDASPDAIRAQVAERAHLSPTSTVLIHVACRWRDLRDLTSLPNGDLELKIVDQPAGAQISNAGATAGASGSGAGTSGPPGPSGQGPLTLRKTAATLGEEVQPGCFLVHYAEATHTRRQQFLVDSGPIKAGKTTCLEMLLPALAAADPVFGVGQAREVITMDILMPNEHTGREGLLSALLSQLMIRWSACQIQVNGRLWGLCHSAQQANNMRQLEDAIMQLVGSLEQHVLFLVDEAQWFLMPRHSDGGLDTIAARNQANFLKRLLYHASDRALWALTGSTMATFWWGLAQMAPNGTPPLTANGLITLSARATDEQIDFCWGQLEKQHGPLPSELKIYAAGSAALLCYHVQEHLLHPGVPIPELVTRIDDKWVVEAGTDWKPSLEGMEKEERKGFYALSVPEEGLDVAAGLQPLYLSQLLCGQLEPIHEGSGKQRLISPLYRMVVQSLIQPDGALMPMPLAKPSSPLVLLEGRQLLLRFANSAMKAQKAGWKGANHQQLLCAVESLGASIEMTTQGLLFS
ncbi:hypothetical protein WJX74_008125 [Apatococcus lobatus]|uniref:ORC1/DEAH AAA+ ATPase domain-containing protein n=1 Tax=Apatococcus lobatus TaxID=904363 RepID=A0AAW1R1W0_9CHLO